MGTHGSANVFVGSVEGEYVTYCFCSVRGVLLFENITLSKYFIIISHSNTKQVRSNNHKSCNDAIKEGCKDSKQNRFTNDTQCEQNAYLLLSARSYVGDNGVHDCKAHSEETRSGRICTTMCREGAMGALSMLHHQLYDVKRKFAIETCRDSAT